LVGVEQGALEGEQFEAEGGPLDFEPLVLAQSNVHLYCPLQVGVLVDELGDVDSYEEVVVLVVLEGDAVAHQQEAVGQPSVAEVDLRALFELVFGATHHQELIELVLGPAALEVVAVGLDLQLLLLALLLLPRLALPQPVAVAAGPQLAVELLHQLQVLHQLRVHSPHPLQRLQLVFDLHGCLHLGVDLLQEGQTDLVVEADEGHDVGVVRVVLGRNAGESVQLG